MRWKRRSGSNLRGVAVDGDGSILVVDGHKHIQKFTLDGQFIRAVGTQGEKPLQFSDTVGIASNRRNKNIYVCDNQNDQIRILNRDLTFSSSFGSPGSGDREFSGVCMGCDIRQHWQCIHSRPWKPPCPGVYRKGTVSGKVWEGQER